MERRLAVFLCCDDLSETGTMCFFLWTNTLLFSTGAAKNQDDFKIWIVLLRLPIRYYYHTCNLRWTRSWTALDNLCRHNFPFLSPLQQCSDSVQSQQRLCVHVWGGVEEGSSGHHYSESMLYIPGIFAINSRKAVVFFPCRLYSPRKARGHWSVSMTALASFLHKEALIVDTKYLINIQEVMHKQWYPIEVAPWSSNKYYAYTMLYMNVCIAGLKFYVNWETHSYPPPTMSWKAVELTSAPCCSRYIASSTLP